MDVAQVIADHGADPTNNPGYIQAVNADTDVDEPEPVWVPQGDLYSDVCGGVVDGIDVIPHRGDLVSLVPESDIGSIVTMAIDPGRRYLFAANSYAVTGHGRKYACPTMFRLDLEDPDATWLPMNEVTSDSTDDQDNRAERRELTYASPTTSEPSR